MKYLIIFLLGAASGAFAYVYFIETPRIAAQSAMPAQVEQPRASSSDKPLTSASIKEELNRTGQVVRKKATEVGHSIASATHRARISAMINAKYTLDRDLSARAISVDVNEGKVTLRGNVASDELIARAISLALDTEGVNEVVSLLTTGNS